MTQRNIKRIVNIIKNRVPYEFGIKFFDTTRDLLKHQARIDKVKLKSVIDYYDKYLNNPKKATYMNTKYYKVENAKTALDISALGGDPIFVSLGSIKKHTQYEFSFLLLHEICHVGFDTLDERKCDLFAIRWIKKLVKEGLIKK